MSRQQRSEWKFLCSDGQLELIRTRLDGILAYDPHAESDGSYRVHSLYFDDYRDSCAAGNEAGSGTRCKYRVRYYGKDTGSLHFEQKEKRYGFGNKTSCAISKEAYHSLLTGDVCSLFWKTDEALLKKYCALSMSRYFTPKAIIDYDRTAFVEPSTHIRITLDRNITAAYDFRSFLSGSYLQIPITKTHQNILEVKFDAILPGWIRKMLESLNIRQTTYSKYYLGRKYLEGFML